MRRLTHLLMPCLGALLAACSTPSAEFSKAPSGWGAPEALVAPSSFTGVHGLAVDLQGRLLADAVVRDLVD